MTAHWGIADPAGVEGSLEEQRKAFMKAVLQLQARINLFLALPITSLDKLSLQRHLDEIGHIEMSPEGLRR